MTDLELLSPAKDLSTGIAAIDCGADAVYLAGPSFGARKDAGNPVSDIRTLCEYAHRFGARVFVTVNTILCDEEIPCAGALMKECEEAGVDAFIVQDLSILEVVRSLGIHVPLHASTQCAIRTVEDALFYERLGFSRLVLERELSLQDVRDIRKAVSCEIEFFVHGALCVCYSGQCYLSEYLAGRSANRGECIQACRSRYDLLDENGRVLVKDKALLSLADYNLLDRLPDLAEAGVCSFKIEGRLKNISYVRNVVRKYSQALDTLVEMYPDRYRRASFGKVVSSFTPDLSKTFNRGYTTLYLDGKRDNGPWSSMDSARSIGERIGTVKAVRHKGPETMITVGGANHGTALSNGDGFCALSKDSVIGFRGDRCEGMDIWTRKLEGIAVGMPLYRNYSAAFEKGVAASPGKRLLRVGVSMKIDCPEESGPYEITLTGTREDALVHSLSFRSSYDTARDPQKMRETLRRQISKEAAQMSFSLTEVILGENAPMPFIPTGEINSFRRELSSALSLLPIKVRPILDVVPASLDSIPGRDFPGGKATYKYNVSNALSEGIYCRAGAEGVEPAYEISHRTGVELMRTRYCIRHELGMCLRDRPVKNPLKLFLRNNARILELGFDCGKCEMTVLEGRNEGKKQG